MARLLGVTIPDSVRIEYALTYIYGIGFSRSNKILKAVQVDRNIQVQKLSTDDTKKIQEYIEKNFQIEGDLKEAVNNNIKRLKEIGSYRGIRHIRNLPVRGQRTRSNARAKRGKRKTIGALRKEDMVKMQQSSKNK